MNNFAFMIHPIEPQKDVARKFPLLGKLPPRIIDFGSRFFPPVYLSHITGIRSEATGEEIAELPLISQRDGAVLTIDDLGIVRDEFTDTASVSELNSHPVLVLSVQRAATEDLLAMVDAVKDFVAEAEMPEGYHLTTW